MSGYAPAELRVSAFDVLSPPQEEGAAAEPALAEALEAGAPWSGELRLRQYSGATLDVAVTLSPTRMKARSPALSGWSRTSANKRKSTA